MIVVYLLSLSLSLFSLSSLLFSSLSIYLGSSRSCEALHLATPSPPRLHLFERDCGKRTQTQTSKETKTLGVSIVPYDPNVQRRLQISAPMHREKHTFARLRDCQIGHPSGVPVRFGTPLWSCGERLRALRKGASGWWWVCGLGVHDAALLGGHLPVGGTQTRGVALRGTGVGACYRAPRLEREGKAQDTVHVYSTQDTGHNNTIHSTTTQHSAIHSNQDTFHST
jgi:hypothetical protein